MTTKITPKSATKNSAKAPAQLQNLMQKIIDSARQGKLVIVVGAGVSIGLTNGGLPSWGNLIKDGFGYAKKKGRITEAQFVAWNEQLNSSDMDDLLAAAEFVGRKLGAPADQVYGRWFQEVFGSAKPTNDDLSSAIKALSDIGVPICTLNYDSLLEAVTGLPTLQVSETQKVLSWMRKEYPAILHLHGFWESPSSCILGIRDYEATLSNEVRDLIQRTLATFNHLLFIGCGDTFADPNFSALTNWLRRQLKALVPQHIALIRENELDKRNVDPSWLGFVEPVSFGKTHEDLAAFLLQHFPRPPSRKVARRKQPRLDESTAVLEEYRKFLLRDCGQMTIEGVSADMDTGQRKFDLERLFVPLDVAACPPEFLPSDPDSGAKLEKWQKENSESRAFGKILAKHKRLALLALPGGGKTLLLKRLTVAYAEPSRRTSSSDELPDLNLLPVLIRCREWRDHIKLPIHTLLKKMGDISGQPKLADLSDALTPLLKKGQILLLVDGLDEIHNDADRTTFVDNLESFLEEHRSIRFVVTSREAGFGLVAPTLSRFCERWRIAPLSEIAIGSLCKHWHRLMTGDTPPAISEGEQVAQTLLKNSALRRLAENPLLLTMLLVVKHGAGGLPPDRVSLYSRAVDVLLDTWNIKGHDPLNAKEAVPQLAYVAFQMMCMGKQTATEKELLALLEEAREKHPNIKRYAKDSPHEFLKRVELRSSLLLEAGHQIEAGRTVPFYQFRHLTFQEYLAAVAATEGHYQQYRQDDTILTPVVDYLLADEWKEVIPMVAVLSRKRAEPLLVDLISKGEALRRKFEAGENDEDDRIGTFEDKLPGPAGRLLQCFIEEAEASPKTISSALQLIAYFSQGCKSSDDWETFCRGPYGEELYRQAWELLMSRNWSDSSWLMNTCAGIAEYQKPLGYWLSKQGELEIRELLQSGAIKDFGRGLLITMGMLWNHSRAVEREIAEAIPIELVESHLANEDSNISSMAIWVWTNTRVRRHSPEPASPSILQTLLTFWFGESGSKRASLASYAMSCQFGIDRELWMPQITEEQALQVRERLSEKDFSRIDHENNEKTASFFVAYHAKTVMTDAELLKHLESIEELNSHMGVDSIAFDRIRKSLGGRARGKRSQKKK